MGKTGRETKTQGGSSALAEKNLAINQRLVLTLRDSLEKNHVNLRDSSKDKKGQDLDRRSGASSTKSCIYIYIYEVCSKLFHRVVVISMLPGCLPGNQPFASGHLPGIGVF